MAFESGVQLAEELPARRQSILVKEESPLELRLATWQALLVPSHRQQLQLEAWQLIEPHHATRHREQVLLRDMGYFKVTLVLYLPPVWLKLAASK